MTDYLASQRGQSRDLIADVVLGQKDFTEIIPYYPLDGRRVYNPCGAAVDTSVTPNLLYVTDIGHNRILVFEWDGSLPLDRAIYAIGQPDISAGSANGDSAATAYSLDRSSAPASATTLAFTSSLAGSPAEGGGGSGLYIDSAGSLWVCDFANHRVLRFPRGSRTANFVIGQADYTGTQYNRTNSLTPAANTLYFSWGDDNSFATGLCGDGAGGLWVCDSGNRRVLHFAAGATTADIVLGQSGFTTRSSGTGLAALKTPTSVALSPTTGKLYVCDPAAGNDRVLVYDPPFTTGMSATSTFSPAATTLQKPMIVQVDPTNPGYVWIMDTTAAYGYLVKESDNSILRTIGNGSSSLIGHQEGVGGSFGIDSLGNVFVTTQRIVENQMTLFSSPIYGATVIADGPSAYWRLDEASGTFIDEIGGLVLTAQGGVSGYHTSGGPRDDKGYFTFGSGGYASSPDATALDVVNATQKFSLECWFKRNNTGQTALISKGNASYLLRFNSSNYLELVKSGSATDASPYVTSSGTYTVDGLWHHVVVTRNGQNTVPKLYVDGVDVSVAGTSLALFSSNSSVFNIARDSRTGSSIFDGDIAEVAFYLRALTADEVAEHYINGATYQRCFDTTLKYSASGFSVIEDMAVTDTQLILADYGRVIFWNDLHSLETGKPADGYLANIFPDATDSGFDYVYGTIYTVAVDRNFDHLWVATGQQGANTSGIACYALPLVSGASPILRLGQSPTGQDISVLGGGTMNPFNSTPVSGTGVHWGMEINDDSTEMWLSYSDTNRVIRIRNPLTSPLIDVVLGQADATSTYPNRLSNYLSLTGPQIRAQQADNTLYSPGDVALDHLTGHLFVQDHMLEVEGNYRLLVFAPADIPSGNSSPIFGPNAWKIYPGIAGWEPAFAPTGELVFGYNFYDPSSLGLANFPGAYLNPTGASEDPQPDELVTDFFSMATAAEFDGDGNLYIGDHNRNLIRIYYTPFGRRVQILANPPDDLPKGYGFPLDITVSEQYNSTDAVTPTGTVTVTIYDLPPTNAGRTLLFTSDTQTLRSGACSLFVDMTNNYVQSLFGAIAGNIAAAYLTISYSGDSNFPARSTNYTIINREYAENRP